MALTDDGGMVMPVSPMYGNGGGNGNGGFGGDWGGWLVLFLLFGLFNRGGYGFGGGGYGGGGGGELGYDFPWLLNASNGTNAVVTNGFQNAQLANQLTGIQSSINSGFGDTALGIAGINQNICQTGNGIISAITNGNNALTQQMYSNQIADLERSYAAQTANTQNLNALQGQLASCCCENRLATANLSALVQSENCADRQAFSEGVRDIIQNQTAGTQRIIDQLCADKIDAKNEKIADLERQLTMASLAASQTAQTAAIRAGQVEEVDALYNRLSNCPVPTMPVYGNQPIFTCQNNNCGCGCGM